MSADDRITSMIEADYRDAWGKPQRSPPETLARLADALGSWPESNAAAVPIPVQRCFIPPWMEQGGRAWGIAVQIYSLRSPRNWGIGDFSDLARLAQRAAAEGADFVAVNPLHALFAGDPGRFSPYSPASREFINVLYLDVTAMQSYADSAAARASVEATSFQQSLTELRAREIVDYAGVAKAKDLICRICFRSFDELRRARPRDPRVQSFDRFIAERGEPLKEFALFQALSLEPSFGSDWTRWPEAYRDPHSAAIKAFATAHAEEIRYHAFLQWEADHQLALCARVARDAGMRIGLYLDLALGTAPESADGWTAQESMIKGFHVGAPPDPWSENGQDWGLFAYHPRLASMTENPIFRRVLDANMRHAGALRLDHVLGFNRLFLVPAQGRAIDGAYLRYPAANFCATIAAASHEHAALVVGEDLGTIPDGLQDLLASYGLLSYRLFIFARDDQGRFLPPEAYPRGALVAIATHDLPTLAGFWTGHDIELRTALRLYPDDAARQRALDERRAAKDAVLQALRNAGLPATDDVATLAASIHTFLARTPSALMLVQIEDLALEHEQINLPGTFDEYPNWRRKLSRDIDAIFDDPAAQKLLAALRAERPQHPSPP